MVRTVYEPDHVARFERVQDDERDHAEWILMATVDAVGGGATLVTELTYTGKLWGSGALQRILDDEVQRGKAALRQLVIDRAHALNRPFGRRSRVRSRPKHSLRPVGVEHVVDRPATQDPPCRSINTWVDVGGMSSTWCVTTTVGGASGSAAKSSRAWTSCSRPPRSRRADGSSSSTMAGSFISVRARSTRWRSPDDSDSSGRSAKRATPMRPRQSSARASSAAS